jgi:GNAT superfamily N-acetyltransferase
VKLPRFGSAESEKPSILDADGNIRDLSVRVATQLDVEAVSTLLVANSAEHGGQLYGNWSVGVVKEWIDNNALTLLAVSDWALLGVLFASEKWQVSAPVALATLKAWPGGNDAYVYGPVCIAPEARGRGVLQALYRELICRRPGREAILFIRRGNIPSLRAHAKLGMIEVASFALGDDEFVVLSTRPSAANAVQEATCSRRVSTANSEK